MQIISGVFLAMYYVSNTDLAFLSVEYIMRNVNYGWFIRYLHANGASFFFLVVYIHMFRGLYYNSYLKPRIEVWCIGVVILLLMILTAFLGYVLPWGQMSFWAATVITSLCSALPFVGESLVTWLWGGYSVDNATLNRFFSFHFVMPFVILAAVFLHFYYLHDKGSTNPTGLSLPDSKSKFHPYYIVKDLFGVQVFFFFFLIVIYFIPNYLGHPDNYIPANPLVTPAHIVPEWYFLPFYAILRSIPNKLLGVLALLLAIVVLFILPFIIDKKFRNASYRDKHSIVFWLFFNICIILGWIGGESIEYPFLSIGRINSFLYFFYFLVILNIIIKYDYKKIYPSFWHSPIKE